MTTESQTPRTDAILTATTEFAASLSRQITDRDATIARLREALEALVDAADFQGVHFDDVTAARAALLAKSVQS